MDLAPTPARAVLQLGATRVDLANREVVHPDRTVVLSPLEVSFLTFLAGRRGTNASREELLAEVWGYSPRAVTRAVDHMVSRLRKKLEPDPAAPRWLVSTRGGGYRLELAPESVPVRLPAERDRFVGRAADLAELAARFEDGARLVTVLGVGGVGKTRLARRFAAARAAQHPGGTWFCDLAEAEDAAGIALAVARQLAPGVSAADTADAVARLLERRGPCLLVLDNFEALAPYAERTAGRWLEANPDLRILTTSRVRLGIAGEHLLPLDPLPPSDAADLLLARATAGGWAPAPDDGEAIAALVAALDGLPLALELAAARIGLVSPQGLLVRMTDRLTALRAQAPRSPRHESLQATLDASWELLAPDERAALAQLAVFDGPMPLPAVEAVLQLDRLSPLEAAQGLVDQSLARAGEADELEMLGLVREYAGQRLDERGDRAEVERRHGAWYSRLGEDPSLARLDGPGGAAAAAELDRAEPNLLAAFRRALARADADTAGKTARAAWRVALRGGSAAASADRLEAALVLPGHGDAARVRLHMDAGWARRIASDYARAAEHYEIAASLARTLGDAALLGRILRAQADSARLQRDAPRARLLYERALVAVRAAGDRLGEAVTLGALGIVAWEQSRLDEARRLLFDALELHRSLGNRRSEAVVLANLGLVASHDDPDRAEAYWTEAAALQQTFGNDGAVARARLNLALLAIARGRLDGLDDTLADIERTTTLQGDGYHLAEVRAARAELHLARRELPQAQRAFEAALAGHRASGNTLGCAIALTGLGVVRAARGDRAGARERLVDALALAEGVGNGRHCGVVSTRLAQLDLDESGPERAEAALAEAERRLATHGDLVSVAIARCVRARAARQAGDEARAEAERHLAEAVARRIGAGPDAELRRLLDAVDPQGFAAGAPPAGR